jgi:RecB family exonuclease
MSDATLPPLSPSRLEAWDRCPAAYRFEYVLRLPQPVADQRPRLLGLLAHGLLEAYLRDTQATGTPAPPEHLDALAQELLARGAVPEATASLMREAAALISPWLAQWTIPVDGLVAIEQPLAVDAGGRLAEWQAPGVFIRGRLDLVCVDAGRATILDWKSGWLSEDEEQLRFAWAPGLYAALLWAWAPRLEAVTVEYHYLRTGRTSRVTLARADAEETLAWARSVGSVIARALATPDDPATFPPRPSSACATCPWVNRCPVGRAALDALDEPPIADESEAQRLAGLLITGEARVGRLRDRLKQYLDDREPLMLNGLELGFFPTKGRYDAAAVARVISEAGGEPWSLLSVDGRALAALFRKQPCLEAALAGARTPTAAWFGHRKAAKNRGESMQGRDDAAATPKG